MKKLLLLILLSPCIAWATGTAYANSSGKAVAAGKAGHLNGNKLNTAHRQADLVLDGFVHDVSGQPLIGVSVMIKGTTTGVQTDANGKFKLSVSTGEVLVFTYLGYVTKEVTVGTSQQLSVQLDEDSKQLSEVVVTALGIKKERRALGYAVSEVK